MKYLLFVAVGGALGSGLRYLSTDLAQRLFGDTFPIGTLTVNVAGCLAIGLLAPLFTGPWLLREEIRVAVVVGVLGGLTTFSSFGLETFALINDGQFGRAAANVALNNVLGLAAVWAGYRLSEHWFGV